MTNNDILRRLRYTFDIDDSKMIELFGSGGKKVNRSEISNWMKKETDPMYYPLRDRDFAAFLNGFINDRRGKKEGPQPAPEERLNNNLIFRKLKISLKLTDSDIQDIFNLIGFPVSRHEITAIFRHPSKSQFRECKDQFLRKFIFGLQVKHRGTGHETAEW